MGWEVGREKILLIEQKFTEQWLCVWHSGFLLNAGGANRSQIQSLIQAAPQLLGKIDPRYDLSIM